LPDRITVPAPLMFNVPQLLALPPEFASSAIALAIVIVCPALGVNVT